MIHDERAQFEALAGLAPYLSAPCETSIARAVTLEEDEALERKDRYRHRRVVARLARRLAAEGHADEAIGVAEALPHSDNSWPSTRFDTLTQVAVTLAASDARAALRAVARISRDSDHGKALAAVLSQVPERQQHEALTLARAMGENVPTSLLTDLTRRQPQDRSTTPAGGHPDSDRERTSSRASAAQSIAAARQAAGRQRAELIVKVAEWLDTDLAQQALELAEDIDDWETKGEAVEAVAARLVTLGQPKEATAAILRLPHIYLDAAGNTNPRVNALWRHFWNLADLGYLDEAREAALELPDRDISTDSVRNDALSGLARRYADIGALRAGLLDCALSIPDDNDRSDALAGYAEAARLAPTVLLPTVRAVLGRAPTLSRRSLLTISARSRRSSPG